MAGHAQLKFVMTECSKTQFRLTRLNCWFNFKFYWCCFTADVHRLFSNKPFTMWAASSEFVSSSIPSWQILTAHAQPFRWARDLAFCLKVPLDSLLVWASSGGSGETARMRRLAWTFAARIGDKYQIRLTRPMSFSVKTIVELTLISRCLPTKHPHKPSCSSCSPTVRGCQDCNWSN